MKSNRSVILLNLRIGGKHWFRNPVVCAMEINSKKLGTPCSISQSILCDLNIFKSRADSKFGEFIVLLKISNINIIQAIELFHKSCNTVFLERKKAQKSMHICTYGGKS
jgi:hypothetical protein